MDPKKEKSGEAVVLDTKIILTSILISMADIVEALGVEIIVPQAVYEEVVVKGRGRPVRAARSFMEC